MRACRDEYGKPLARLTDIGPGEFRHGTRGGGIEKNRNDDEMVTPWDPDEMLDDRLVKVARVDAGLMIMSKEHWEAYKRRRDGVDNA